MSTNPPPEPEIPPPDNPPETPSTPQEPVPSRPDEITPVPPDIDNPDRGPEETPPDRVDVLTSRGAVEPCLGSMRH